MQFSYQFVIAMGIYIFSLVFDKKLLAIILSLFGFYVAFKRLFYTEQIKYEDDVRLAEKISEKIELLNLGRFRISWRTRRSSKSIKIILVLNMEYNNSINKDEKLKEQRNFMDISNNQ